MSLDLIDARNFFINFTFQLAVIFLALKSFFYVWFVDVFGRGYYFFIVLFRRMLVIIFDESCCYLLDDTLSCYFRRDLDSSSFKNAVVMYI